MTYAEYLKIKDADTALTVRLAVTVGWVYVVYDANRVIVREYWGNNYYGIARHFNPFTDASIPYGLIGRGVQGCMESALGDFYAWCVGTEIYKSEMHKSKTHAVLNAYCAADPMGHWARFTGEKS